MSHENYEGQAVAIKHVRIVGMGLIGTSIGLGLASKGVSVEVEDMDPKALGIAQDLLQHALKNGTPCGNPGAPSSKTKYTHVTDSA